MLADVLDGLGQALSPPALIWLLVGAGVGLVIGVLPAVGATVGVVVFLPFTYGMDLPTALVFLLAIYTTGQYGDSVSSILCCDVRGRTASMTATSTAGNCAVSSRIRSLTVTAPSNPPTVLRPSRSRTKPLRSM